MNRNRWNRLGVLSAVTLVIAAVAGVVAGSPSSSVLEPSVVYADAPPAWADGLDHVMVFTDRSPTTPGAPSVADAAAAALAMPSTTTAPAIAVETTVADRVDGRSQHLSVQRVDGSIEQIDVDPELFHELAPRTDAERAALAAAADNPLALLVEDRNGAIGAAKARYVLTLDALIEVDEAPPTTPVPTSADTALDVVAPQPGGSAADDEMIVALSAAPGVESVERVTNGTYTVATSGARAALEAVPGVMSLADDLQVFLVDDPGRSLQWALLNTGAAAQTGGTSGTPGADANVVPAWAVSQGRGVTVAVIDTGVDLTHPDLSAQLWRNAREICGNGVDDDANGYADDCNGWDFGVSDSNPNPDTGAQGGPHGTHVAGIVAAGLNGVGVVGSAPGANIMAVKVATTSGILPLSAIYAGIVYATDNGAKVINMSLATSLGAQRAWVSGFEAAVEYATSRGVTVVAAAGNNGVDIGVTPLYPANFSLYYDGVITVGASTNRDARASFSNFGTPVNVYAPGLSIYSTKPGTYGFMSGTSMSAPMVAGAVADEIAAGVAATPAAARIRTVWTARSLPFGPLLDVTAAVGTGTPSAVQVFYDGVDAMRPDTAGDIAVRIEATSMPAGVTAAKVSVATIDNGVVYAVGSLPVTVRTPGGGSTSIESGTDGSLATVPLGAATSVSASQWQFMLNAPIPSGMYAVVTELVDGTGTASGGTYVGFLQIAAADQGGGTATTVVATSVPSNPITPTTSPAGGGTGGGGGGVVPTTSPTAAPGVPTTSPTVTPTTTPSTSPGATPTTVVSTTVPGKVPGGGVTTPTTTPTTVPGVAPTTPPVVATTSPIAVPSPTTPGPTTSATSPATTPATTTPVSTTPTPPGDSVGFWRLDSMSPRYAVNTGGVPLTLQGFFPVNVPVYVWFGNLAAVAATSDGATLKLTSPTIPFTGVVDIDVRFTTASTVTLTLPEAFTFGDPTGTTPPTPDTTAPTRTPATTTPSGSGTSPTTAPAASPGTTIGGGVTSTTTKGVSSTVPGTATTLPGTATTAPARATTVPGAVTTTTMVQRGTLQLRPPAANGTISRLSASLFPTSGCALAACPATSL